MKVFKTLFSPEDSTTTTSNLQVTVSQIIPVFTVLILHRHCYRPGQLQANQVYQLTTSIQVGVYTARGNPILGGNSTRTEIFFRQTEQPSHSGRRTSIPILSFVAPVHFQFHYCIFLESFTVRGPVHAFPAVQTFQIFFIYSGLNTPCRQRTQFRISSRDKICTADACPVGLLHNTQLHLSTRTSCPSHRLPGHNSANFSTYRSSILYIIV